MEDRHITWENFEAHFLRSTARSVHPIPGTPPIEIFFEPTLNRLGFRARCSGSIGRADRGMISVREVEIGGEAVLEAFVGANDLFRPFFYVALNFADLVQLQGIDPSGALAASLSAMRRLVAANTPISREEEIGLWGELWFVKQVIDSDGVEAISAWLTPAESRHDFHLPRSDVEVKTTLRSSRVHHIHGFDQLTPADGRPLDLLSVQIEETTGEDGISIRDHVQHLEEHLSGRDDLLVPTREKLRVRKYTSSWDGWRDFRLRCPPYVVPIGKSFPQISQAQLPADSTSRFLSVSYEFNFEGMGASLADSRLAVYSA